MVNNKIIKKLLKNRDKLIEKDIKKLKKICIKELKSMVRKGKENSVVYSYEIKSDKYEYVCKQVVNYMRETYYGFKFDFIYNLFQGYIIKINIKK